MKKVLAVAGLTVCLMAGCQNMLNLNYEGKKYTERQLEEKIEDKIERENKNLDVEVDIYKEDKKSKKSKKSSKLDKLKGVTY